MPVGEVGEKVERLWKAGKRDLAVVVVAAMGMEIVIEDRERYEGLRGVGGVE